MGAQRHFAVVLLLTLLHLMLLPSRSILANSQSSGERSTNKFIFTAPVALAVNSGVKSDGSVMISDKLRTKATAAAGSLPPQEIKRRATSAFLGAVVGDAAAQTSHWNYDRSTFHSSLMNAGRYDDPEFFVKNSFYRVDPGGQSCYGDQMLEVARHIVSYRDGSFPDGSALTSPDGRSGLISRFERAFGHGSQYGPFPSPQPQRESMPVEGPWRHGSLNGFLENLAKGQREYPYCGSADEQVDVVARVVPVVCAYAGRRDLPELVEAVVRVTQNTDKAVQFGFVAARILEACILGTAETVREAIEIAIQSADERNEKETCGMILLVLEVLDRLSSVHCLEPALEELMTDPKMRAVLTSPVSLVT